MQCTVCRREAIIFQPYSGKHLCPVHFIKDVEAKAKRTIRMHRWLHPKDHIAVALSGDSVSAALLFFLSKLTGNRRDIRLSAITIDPGIAGYKVKEHAGKTAAACDVAWFSGSFAERYGITADEIFRREGRERACRTCEILKKDLIGDLAQEQGITSCAFATTIDDIATSFFTDILFGTVERTFFPSWVIGTNPIPVIRPFIEIPATEINQYADLHASSFLQPCPYTGCSTGVPEIQKELDAYASRHPATKFALANMAGTLAGFASVNKRFTLCPVCGGLMEDGTCEVCEIRCKMKQGTIS